MRLLVAPLILAMHHDIPVPTIHLFSPLDQLLIELLHSLTAEEWALQTLAPAWKVKDVAAHLLAGNVRNLSISRDNFYDPSAAHISTYQDVVQYLNLINNDWVKAMQSVSPQMLITLLSITNSLYSDHLAKLDPIEKAIFPVAWAGDEESQNWFHIAREYTEKWHHQQQIRHALGHASPLFSKTFLNHTWRLHCGLFHIVLEIFMQNQETLFPSSLVVKAVENIISYMKPTSGSP